MRELLNIYTRPNLSRDTRKFQSYLDSEASASYAQALQQSKASSPTKKTSTSSGNNIWKHGGRYYYRDASGTGREVDRRFIPYLKKHGTEGVSISNSGTQLVDGNGTSWFTNGRVFNKTYGKGSWNTSSHTFIGWDRDKRTTDTKATGDVNAGSGSDSSRGNGNGNGVSGSSGRGVSGSSGRSNGSGRGVSGSSGRGVSGSSGRGVSGSSGRGVSGSSGRGVSGSSGRGVSGSSGNTPATHNATYTAKANATGAFAANVNNFKTTAWGGSKGKGVLDNEISNQFNITDAELTALSNKAGHKVTRAEAAQMKLRDAGYGITVDGHWGKQSQAIYDDYLARLKSEDNAQIKSGEMPQLNVQKPTYGTFNKETNKYTYNPDYEVTSDDLKNNGITNWEGYNAFMSNEKNKTSKIYQAFQRYQQQSGKTLDNQENFNAAFGTKGRFGKMDRNKILSTMGSTQATWESTPERNEEGKQYDNFSNLMQGYSKGNNWTFNKDNIRYAEINGKKSFVYKNGDDYYNLDDKGVVQKMQPKYTYDSAKGTYTGSYRRGGQIQKYQQGGTMDEQQMQQAFLQFLAQQTGAKSEEELQQVIQQMGQDGLKQAYAQFVQAMQQQQVQAARFGAKLNYINKLNGKCPDGTQAYYYKDGGSIKKVCKKCMQMEQNGGPIEKGDSIQQFKDAWNRNKKKFGNKYDSDQLAGRKPVGKDSKGRDLYLDGDGNAKPVVKKK